jgi:uncharacterized RDD family membrane protein YckC
VTSFREYRQALAEGRSPDYQAPVLPRDAIALQGDRAGFVTRALAALIDVLIIFLLVLGTIAVIWMISFIIDPMSPGTPLTEADKRVPDVATMIIYGYCLNAVYWTVFWHYGGRTIGNLIMGLRVVNRHGQQMGWWTSLLRAMFCTVFPFGLLWSIVSGANRSVQDVVLRTNVIYDWVISIPGFRKSAPAQPSILGED